MAEIFKKDMLRLWAETGDIVPPTDEKISTGWAVEVVPRQWWNWMQNRVDTNVAYMLQKGIPEWDGTTEYIAGKSYVQHNNVIYKSIQTGTNQNPATATTYWQKALVESSASMEAIKAVVPSADTIAYFTGATTAASTSLSSFGRTLIDDLTAAAARTTLGLSNSATIAATNLNTGNTIVQRDASGNFSAGTITATLSGNATTATTANALTTGRTISLAGDVTGSASFDGSANVSITATVIDDSHNHIISNVDGLQAELLKSDWIHSDRDFQNGTLITTAIDYSQSSGAPWILEIKGNSYSTQFPFDIQCQGYIYDNTIINVGGYSNGSYITGIVAINVGGNLCFWFPRQQYWQGFAVRAYSAISGYAKNEVVSITDSSKPSGTKEVAITPHIAQSLHSANFTEYAPSLTGSGASGTWPIAVSGNAATATKLATARSISLAGGVTGSASFDGSSNVSITATVADDSHNHVISNVDGLQAALDLKVSKDNVVGTVSQSGGVPTGAVVERGSNANGEYVRFADGTQICTIVKSGMVLNITTAIGSSFYEQIAVGDYAYPAAFSGQLPKLSFSNWVGNGIVSYSVATEGSLNTSPLGYFSSPVAQPTVTVSFFHITAIGRWY